MVVWQVCLLCLPCHKTAPQPLGGLHAQAGNEACIRRGEVSAMEVRMHAQMSCRLDICMIANSTCLVLLQFLLLESLSSQHLVLMFCFSCMHQHASDTCAAVCGMLRGDMLIPMLPIAQGRQHQEAAQLHTLLVHVPQYTCQEWPA